MLELRRSCAGGPASGFSLIETLITVAIVGLVIGTSVPAIQTITKKRALAAATAELRSILHLARSRAIARGTNSAVKFSSSPEGWVYSIYDDGDSDGVRNDDIARGIDRRVSGPTAILQSDSRVWIGIPAWGAPDPDTGEKFGARSSPVRFNRSTLCAFSPLGSGTPGSIFLTTSDGDLALVRVFGATGRIRLLRLNRATLRWDSR